MNDSVLEGPPKYNYLKGSMTGIELKEHVVEMIREGINTEALADEIIELVSRHERRKTLVAFTDYCAELGI
jgi:hypothetical protein